MKLRCFGGIFVTGTGIILSYRIGTINPIIYRRSKTMKARKISALLLAALMLTIRDASHSCDGVRHMDMHSDKKKSACMIASAVLIDLRCDVFSCSNKIDLLFHKHFQVQVKNVMRGEDKLSQMTFLLSFWRCMRKAFADIITDIIRLFIELVVQYQQPKMKSEIPLLKDQVEFRFAQSRFTLSYE